MLVLFRLAFRSTDIKESFDTENRNKVGRRLCSSRKIESRCRSFCSWYVLCVLGCCFGLKTPRNVTYKLFLSQFCQYLLRLPVPRAAMFTERHKLRHAFLRRLFIDFWVTLEASRVLLIPFKCRNNLESRSLLCLVACVYRGKMVAIHAMFWLLAICFYSFISLLTFRLSSWTHSSLIICSGNNLN